MKKTEAQSRANTTTLTIKLLISTLLVSSLITFFITIAQIIFDYKQEMATLSSNVKLAQDGHTVPLTLALWEFNEHAIEQTLKSIVLFPGIVRADIVVDGYVKYKAGRENIDSTIPVESKLTHQNSSGKNENLGTFRIFEDNELVYKRILDRVILIFISQFIKTLIVSSLLLIVFRFVVVTRILSIEKFLRNFHLGHETSSLPTSDNSLSRVVNSDDEINVLQGSIELLLKRIDESFNRIKNFNIQLKKSIEEATATLVSQREILERESKLSALGNLSLHLGHEINNPLMSVIGFAEIALSKLSESKDSDVTSELNNIVISSQRIAKITHSMRMLGRSDDLETLKSVPLKPILDDVLILLSNKMSTESISIEITETKSGLTIYANGTHVMQIFMNLISNAIDAVSMNNQKIIKVHIMPTETHIIIDIIDNGPGIPPHILEKIWEPFYTTKEVGKGTGLGLSIVKSLVQRQRGGIEYLRENNFSIFRLTFPISPHTKLLSDS